MKLLNKITKKLAQNEPISKDAVIAAFILLLGREPESEEAVDAHLGLASLDKLREAIMSSEEFKSKVSLYDANEKWVATDVLDRYIMWVDLHDRYVSYGCLNNDWEPDETRFFESRLREGCTVLDIGANIGWFSLVAARKIGLNGRIHAFEPRPVTSKMLARTIASNNLQSIIKLWDCALSDSPGTVKLSWGVNTDNPGGSFISKQGSIDGHESVSVRTVRLDDLLPEVDPEIIKIDVEGAEPLVFKGGSKMLKRSKPLILSELHPAQLKRVSNCTSAEYISQMEHIGYKCYLLLNGQPTDKLIDFPYGSGCELVSVVFEWQG